MRWLHWCLGWNIKMCTICSVCFKSTQNNCWCNLTHHLFSHWCWYLSFERILNKWLYICIWSVTRTETSSPNCWSVSHSASIQKLLKTELKDAPSSCFYSLSQALVAIQLTRRHTGAALIASLCNEWVKAYGGKGGECRDDGQPSALAWRSLLRSMQVAPFVTEGPCFNVWSQLQRFRWLQTC